MEIKFENLLVIVIAEKERKMVDLVKIMRNRYAVIKHANDAYQANYSNMEKMGKTTPMRG